jgi:hypothetical protein
MSNRWPSFKPFAMIISKSLLVKVARRMGGFDVNVGPVDATLQKTPEVLPPVGVDLAAHVLDGMVNRFVLEFVRAPGCP